MGYEDAIARPKAAKRIFRRGMGIISRLNITNFDIKL